jgi:hypothetical protein
MNDSFHIDIPIIGPRTAIVPIGKAGDPKLSISSRSTPWRFQLRTLQTMAEILVERNSTIIFLAQFMTTVQEGNSIMESATFRKWLADRRCRFDYGIMRNEGRAQSW